jgi:hypothetical protein
MAVSHIKNETRADKTGTVTFWDGASTTTAVATDLVRPSDWNSVHNEYYTLSGNTSLSSTASGSNVVLSATGTGVTLIGSSNTVLLSAPAASLISFFMYPIELTTTAGQQTDSFDTTNFFVFPFLLPNDGSFSYFRLALGGTNSTTLDVIGTGSSANASFQFRSSWSVIFYSQGTGASSLSLVSAASSTMGWTLLNSISVLANGSQYTITNQMIGFREGAPSTWTNTTAISNAQYIWSTTPWGTSISGARYIDIPFGSSLSAGMWWVAIGFDTSTSQNSTRDYGMSKCIVWQYTSHEVWDFIYSKDFNEMGAVSDSLNAFLGLGLYSTVGSVSSSIIALSQITFTNSGLKPYFQLVRQA